MSLAKLFIGVSLCGTLTSYVEQQSSPCWSTNSPVCDNRECFDVGFAWAGQPLQFGLVTQGQYQVVAWYDEQRHLRLAERTLGHPFERKVTLPTTVSWDSHNGIAITIDPAGYIHVAANMHASPLIYFTSRKPRSIASVTRASIGQFPMLESVTYPQFLTGGNGKIFLLLRTGKSGAGGYAIFEQSGFGLWKLVNGTEFIDFGAVSSPYISGPYQDRKGTYHIAWTIRDTRDASTNHDLFYARSSDLWHWTDSQGKPISLPIGKGKGEQIAVIPTHSGLLNGNIKMGFDAFDEPFLVYTKNAASGKMDINVTRLSNGGWLTSKALTTNVTWNFHGGGSIENKVNIYTPEYDGETSYLKLALEGQGLKCALDDQGIAKSCKPLAGDLPSPLLRPTLSRPGMQVRVSRSQDFLLRWETLPANRDVAVSNPPPPSKLQLFNLETWRPCN